LDILSVKKEERLSASEVAKVKVGGDDADLRWNGLVTV